MTDDDDLVNSLNYILFVHNGEIRGVDRVYVESKCQWLELTMRAASWRIRG